MSFYSPVTAKETKIECPLNDNKIDVIPECYHYSNHCLCFMCTCGQHSCPSQKKTIYTKGVFQSNYKRTYSKPSFTPPPQRGIKTLYHPNTQKMDLETEYMKRFPGFTVESIPVTQSSTPQPSFKFKGNSQYHRDYPDWGPVDHINVKRPVQPLHDTKLKFQAMSSYEIAYQSIKSPSPIHKTKSMIAKTEGIKLPLQSSSHRDYQKISNAHFPQHQQRKQEEYVPLCYSPNQFKTTANESYTHISGRMKDPITIRKQALFGK